MQGQFITIEGIDGAGKSTHLESLKSRLQLVGKPVLATREPGGTAVAEQIRGLLLNQGMDTLTEALLVFAARRDHLQSVVEPALARGEIVLCDRFSDATFAYQGAGRGMDWQVLLDLEHLVQGQRQPDLTLWFDLPAEVAAQRRAAARDPDRFERLDVCARAICAACWKHRTALPGSTLTPRSTRCGNKSFKCWRLGVGSSRGRGPQTHIGAVA